MRISRLSVFMSHKERSSLKIRQHEKKIVPNETKKSPKVNWDIVDKLKLDKKPIIKKKEDDDDNLFQL